MTVYVSIGNSDDKLTQAEWATFWEKTSVLVLAYASQVHGGWTSAPTAPWQNACWAFDLDRPDWADRMKRELSALAAEYKQDSIAWAEAETEFI